MLWLFWAPADHLRIGGKMGDLAARVSGIYEFESSYQPARPVSAAKVAEYAKMPANTGVFSRL